MKQGVLFALALAVAACAGPSASGQERLVEALGMRFSTTKPVLVVGSLARGDYLPQDEECARPGVICMDPPPFWFRLRVRDVVHGAIGARSLRVVTTSHYGMMDFDARAKRGREEAQYLVLLRTDGTHFAMPRYAMRDLRELPRRGLYFPIADHPLHWLPCSVDTLREPIPPEADEAASKGMAFTAAGMAMPRREIDRMGGNEAPGEGIFIDALREHLAKRPSESIEWSCEYDDGA